MQIAKCTNSHAVKYSVGTMVDNTVITMHGVTQVQDLVRAIAL